jgi:molybdopterin converting factor small subunit
MAPSEHTVEFFGIPRQRAGVAETSLVAADVAELLAEMETRFPRLAPLREEGRLSPHYVLSLDGLRFLTSLDERLTPGSRLLLLSADAGG